MKDHSENFADQLGRYLIRAGLTQQELASKTGVHRNTIGKWMNRTSRPEFRWQVLRLADELFLTKDERKAFIQAAGFFLERWPTEIWTVPQQQDIFFTGRDDILQSLRQLLAPGSTTALTQAISGLGGIGKTATAVEYAHRFHQYYEAVLWLQAASWEILTLECMNLVDELGLPEQKEMDQVVADVQCWLQKHRHWLLILDNVENPQEILPKFVPTGHHGCILVTTRVRDLEPLAQTQEFPIMTEEEGVLFLLRRTKKIAPKAGLEQASPEQYNEAQQIWQDLGGLPLALDQAGAYILETHCSFLAYRELYNRRRAEPLLRRGKRFIGHEESVATTFSLAFEQVKALNPMAADILQICSLLYSEAIPEEFFEVGAEYLGPHLATERDSRDLAMGVLQDYSLVQRNTDAKTLIVHRLVQAVLEDAMKTSDQEVWTERVIAAMNTVFPHVKYTTWSQCARLVPHALVCAARTQSRKSTSIDLSSLLSKTAMYLEDRGQYLEALPLQQRALAISEQVLGPTHPDTAQSLNNLAGLYAKQGRYNEALPLYQRALAIFEQVLSPTHPDTVRSLNDLALLYTRQGKYIKALPLQQRALAISEQVLGPTHPGTMSILNNLALLYSSEGKNREALPLFQRALVIRERELGPTHPDTAQSLNNLALLYAKQGRYNEALPLYQRALTIQEQELGPAHPNSMAVRANYSEVLTKMKQKRRWWRR